MLADPGNTMRDPNPIYQGRYKDHFPDIRSAGKLFPIGERASGCLTEIYPRPITPPVVQKFLNTRRPGPGSQTVFYGRANDPNIGKFMTHGVSTRSSYSAGLLVNPRPKSLFQQKQTEKKESLYFSHQWKPLGKSHDQLAAFPSYLDLNGFPFGQTIKRGLSAGEVLNPPKSYQELDEESKKGHELYVVTHNDYNVGEIRNRKYGSTHFQTDKTFGMKTPHFTDGRNVRRSMQWLSEKYGKEGANIVFKRLDDFRERTQPQVGKGLDPMADTRNLPADHTFGAPLQHEKYGVGDLIQYRTTNYLRGKERLRANLAAVQQHLKKANYQNFGSLVEAFRHYDKNGDGKIDKDDLKRTCDQFGLDLDVELLDSLLEYCDVDNDGLINFVEFANFLNWKDKMGITELEEKILTQGSRNVNEIVDSSTKNKEEFSGEGLVKQTDLELKEEGFDKTPKILPKPEPVKGFYCTSSSKISAVVGGPSSVRYHTCGVPSIRRDLVPPHIRKISDRYNYGDESGAFKLIRPSIFEQNMVSERDLLKPRSKEEITEILRNIGFSISNDNFDQLWNLASDIHPRGDVCVETIRNALDHMQAPQIIMGS
ncbi:EF-hand domain-containing family member B [Pelobates fuscus]|uniref:EF-hand domain-containing family member B n=1 Tax=Pelobates fuscus TaxID=191477 RepID=UPI002FE4A6D8